jgi:hypothetical protein
MNENEFFREATLRICGNLEIEKVTFLRIGPCVNSLIDKGCFFEDPKNKCRPVRPSWTFCVIIQAQPGENARSWGLNLCRKTVLIWI